MEKTIVCPHCGNTNTKKTKMRIVFMEDERNPKRTRQDITGMKCLDCMELYRNDIVNLLEYGVFEIEDINIEIAEE